MSEFTYNPIGQKCVVCGKKIKEDKMYVSTVIGHAGLETPPLIISHHWECCLYIKDLAKKMDVNIFREVASSHFEQHPVE